MKQFLLVLAVLAGGLFSCAPAVLADSQSISSATITLTGVVLPMRYIYLDKMGDIQKVVGNTSQNLVPSVFNYQHQLVPLTGEIAQQYQRLLDENGGVLQASQVYPSDKYNPYIQFARWVVTNPYFSQKII